VLTAMLSNPGTKNAYTPAMGRDLDGLRREVDYDESIRVVILTGEGDAFCGPGPQPPQWATRIGGIDPRATGNPSV